MDKDKTYEVVSNIDGEFVDHALETEERSKKKNAATAKTSWKRFPLWGALVAAALLVAVTVTVSLVVANIGGEKQGQQGNQEPQGGVIQTGKFANLMDGIEANPVPNVGSISSSDAEAVAGFAAKLLKNARKNGENNLVSPVSVLAALSMTANGAKGETLAQMEQTLGMSLSDLNRFFKAYVNSLPQDEKNKLCIADSIWFRSNTINFNRDFLQANADYYGAAAYEADFSEETLEKINDWVKTNTDGMIPKILDRIQNNDIMYLINALVFEAEWQDIYAETDIFTRDFTLENGTKKSVELMCSEENTYIETAKSTGFIKPYANRKYAFAALLPNEGVTVSELIDSLDGKTVIDALANGRRITVSAAIPKFEYDFSTDLSETLKAMGMTAAFDGAKADFSGIGEVMLDGRTRIGRVIQKTFISVAEKGTKAGAATAVQMSNDSVPFITKSVILNRPFVYMLIDLENNVPFFIGTFEDVNG